MMSLIMKAVQKQGRDRLFRFRAQENFPPHSPERDFPQKTTTSAEKQENFPQKTTTILEKNRREILSENPLPESAPENFFQQRRHSPSDEAHSLTPTEKSPAANSDAASKSKTAIATLAARMKMQNLSQIPEELAAGHVILKSARAEENFDNPENHLQSIDEIAAAAMAEMPSTDEKSPRHFHRWVAWGAAACAGMALTTGGLFYGQQAMAQNSAVKVAKSNAARAQELQKVAEGKSLPLTPTALPPLPQKSIPSAPLLTAKTSQIQQEISAIVTVNANSQNSKTLPAEHIISSISQPVRPSGNVAKTLQDSITALDIRGIQIAPFHSRAIINNRLVQQGETFHCENSRLTFRGIENSMLLFQDDRGMTYSRHLRQRNSHSHGNNF